VNVNNPILIALPLGQSDENPATAGAEGELGPTESQAKGLGTKQYGRRTAAASLKTNIVWLYLAQGLNYATPLLLMPYLMRVLGPDRYGLVVLSQSMAQYFMVATDYGFNFSATRDVAVNRGNRRAVARIFWTVLSIKAALLLLGAAVTCAIVVYVPRFHAEPLFYLTAYLSVIGTAIFPQWLFQGMESMRSISMITGAAKLAATGSIFCFVHKPTDALLAMILLSAGQLAGGVIGVLVGLHRYVGAFVRPTRAGVLAAIRDGQHLFISTASIALYTNTNTFLVGLIAGNVQAAYFSIADKLVRATTGVIYPIVQAAYPHAIRLVSQSKRDCLAFIRKTVGYGGALTAFAGIAIVALARPIGHAVFGHEVLAVLPLIRCAAVIPLLATIEWILGTLALIPFGCERAQSKLLAAVGVVNLALASLLISAYGALGGVISMVIIEVILVAGTLAVLFGRGIDIFRTNRCIHP
jgi:PST family polysaccharide transporter